MGSNERYIFGNKIGVEVDNGLVEHPVFKFGESVVEPVFGYLDVLNNSWKFVCAVSSSEGVVVRHLPQADIAGLASYTTTQACELKSPSNMFENTIYYHIAKSRNILLNDENVPDAVMIISNDDPNVNNARARVGVTAWNKIAEVNRVTGRELPNLICNGYDWNVKLMKEIAQQAYIPKQYIQDVILKHPAYTMDHGRQMVEQLDSLPKRLMFVTSSEHLARVDRHLQQDLGDKMSISGFEAPSGLPKRAFDHEVQTLERWQSEYISEQHYPQTTLVESPLIWPQVAAGLVRL